MTALARRSQFGLLLVYNNAMKLFYALLAPAFIIATVLLVAWVVDPLVAQEGVDPEPDQALIKLSLELANTKQELQLATEKLEFAMQELSRRDQQILALQFALKKMGMAMAPAPPKPSQK